MWCGVAWRACGMGVEEPLDSLPVTMKGEAGGGRGGGEEEGEDEEELRGERRGARRWDADKLWRLSGEA